MALVRVYCGLASADLNAAPPGSETWLTVAVVDDSGRLLDICDISDDATGFAELGSLLAERSNGLESVAVAADSDEHIVIRLLTAAGRYLAYTDEDSAEDYAERFGDDESADEIQSSPAERRAIGLARALQAGVLSAVAQATPRDLLGLKPVLAAHAAVTTGRQGAAATLREVLRELYPAALRAFPDPAEPIPLAILDALPEPGPLGSNTNGRGRDAQAIAELAESGVADSATLTEAVTALRVAIAETPRRTGMSRSITSAVAETVRQSVAAVRACDAGATALVSVLSARMPTASAPVRHTSPSRSRAAAAPTAEPTPPSTDESTRTAAGRRTRTAAVRPRSAPPAAVKPQSAPPAAVKPQSAPPAVVQPASAPPAATPAATRAVSPAAVAPAVSPAPVAPAVSPAPVAPAVSPAPVTPAAKPAAVAPAATPAPVTPNVPPAPVTPNVPPAPVTPAASPAAVTRAAKPAAAAATPGIHSTGAVEPSVVQPAPRTRSARRAAEKQAEEQAAAVHAPTPVQTPAAAPIPVHAPTPVQTPAAAPIPVHVPPPPPVPLQSPPAAIPVPPPATVPTPVHPAAQAQPEPAVVRSQQVPSVPPPGLTPAYPTGPVRPPVAPFADSRATTEPEPARPSFTMASGPVPSAPLPARPTARTSMPTPSGPSPVSGPLEQSSRASGLGDAEGYGRVLPEYAGEAGARPAADVSPPGSRASWPLVGEGTRETDEAARAVEPHTYRQPAEGRTDSRRVPESRPTDLPHRSETARTEMPRLDFSRAVDLPAAETSAADLAQREGRVVPPWQSTDLPAEPPALRLVEPAPLTDPALSGEPPQYRDGFSGDLRLEPPALRLVETNGAANGNLNGAANGNLNGAANGDERLSRPVSSRKPSAEPSEPPTKDEADGDLLIFAEARSAWFTDHFGEEEAEPEFANASDEGWRAAKHAAEPAVGAATESGLPRRVPQENLVPGSPITSERPLRVVRDPAAIAAHTSGYFRGWRRGQEVGGYRVGGRPGRESTGGWDFSRDQGDDERGYEYRSARR